MIIERKTYRTKHFSEQAVAEFIRQVWNQIEFPHASRISRPIVGPYNVVYHEMEFESIAERQAFWAAFFARPEMPEWMDRWKELVETGGGTELWTLEE